MGGKFKFQVQDSDMEYIFWRFDKHVAFSEKKLPLEGKYFNSSPILKKMCIITTVNFLL